MDQEMKHRFTNYPKWPKCVFVPCRDFHHKMNFERHKVKNVIFE